MLIQKESLQIQVPAAAFQAAAVIGCAAASTNSPSRAAYRLCD